MKVFWNYIWRRQISICCERERWTCAVSEPVHLKIKFKFDQDWLALVLKSAGWQQPEVPSQSATEMLASFFLLL